MLEVARICYMPSDTCVKPVCGFNLPRHVLSGLTLYRNEWPRSTVTLRALSVCVCVHVCVYTYLSEGDLLFVYVCVCVCVCVCLHVQAFGPSFSHVCGLLFQCTSMCVCICVCVNI